MKELFRNKYPVTLRTQWTNEFITSINNSWNVCLNVEILLPTLMCRIVGLDVISREGVVLQGKCDKREGFIINGMG